MSKKANPNYTYLKENVPKHRYTLLQGGTRSGKTFSSLYYIIYLCTTYNGLEIDIVRETFTALKATVWKDLKELLVKHNLYDPYKHNKTDKIYELNGNYINYYGTDDPQKVHGRSRDFIYINEANQLDKETIDQLFPRTRHRIIMDYNPAMPVEHWLDEYIEKSPPLITTYLDNPHLTKAQIQEIEDRKKDSFWWTIYGTGERCRPAGVIIENWSEGEFDESIPFIWGMDFGVNDPTTLVKVGISENKLFVKEYLYSSDLSSSKIVDIIKAHVGPNEFIVADNSDQLTINDIRIAGFNVQKAVKGKDSVKHGLRKLRDYELIVDPKSMNIKKELYCYVWADNKSETPVKGNDHTIDPIRYALQVLDRRKGFFVI